jgi:hypothetical protein
VATHPAFRSNSGRARLLWLKVTANGVVQILKFCYNIKIDGGRVLAFKLAGEHGTAEDGRPGIVAAIYSTIDGLDAR